MSKYKEIFRLKEKLDEANIEYEFFDRSIFFDEEYYQICCPNFKDRYISVIEGYRNIRRISRQIRNNGVVNKKGIKRR